MPLAVSFMSDTSIKSASVLGVGRARAAEKVALSGTSAISAQNGEWAFVTNTETSSVQVAHGSTPDATATAETAATSAFVVLGPGASLPIPTRPGDKIAVVAYS